MSTLNTIRDEIAVMEARVAKLRKIEAVLAELEDEAVPAKTVKVQKAKAPAKPVAKPAVVPVVKRGRKPAKVVSIVEHRGRPVDGGESTPTVILNLLSTEGPLPRAEIESRVREGREIGKQTVSVALQRLRQAGKILLDGNEWRIAA